MDLNKNNTVNLFSDNILKDEKYDEHLIKLKELKNDDFENKLNNTTINLSKYEIKIKECSKMLEHENNKIVFKIKISKLLCVFISFILTVVSISKTFIKLTLTFIKKISLFIYLKNIHDSSVNSTIVIRGYNYVKKRKI